MLVYQIGLFQFQRPIFIGRKPPLTKLVTAAQMCSLLTGIKAPRFL